MPDTWIPFIFQKRKQRKFWLALFLIMFCAVAYWGIYFAFAATSPTGYYCMIESIELPSDITQQPRATVIAYDTDGTTEIRREVVAIPRIPNDATLRQWLWNWTTPWAREQEKRDTLQALIDASQLIGVKIEHEIEQ